MNIFLAIYIKSEWCGWEWGKLRLQRGGGVWYTEGRRKGNDEVIKRQ